MLLEARMLPFVYTLMARKSEVLYKRLLIDLVDFSAEKDIILNLQLIMTDRKYFMIKAFKSEFI